MFQQIGKNIIIFIKEILYHIKMVTPTGKENTAFLLVFNNLGMIFLGLSEKFWSIKLWDYNVQVA